MKIHFRERLSVSEATTIWLVVKTALEHQIGDHLRFLRAFGLKKFRQLACTLLELTTMEISGSGVVTGKATKERQSSGKVNIQVTRLLTNSNGSMITKRK